MKNKPTIQSSNCFDLESCTRKEASEATVFSSVDERKKRSDLKGSTVGAEIPA